MQAKNGRTKGLLRLMSGELAKRNDGTSPSWKRRFRTGRVKRKTKWLDKLARTATKAFTIY